MAVSRPLTSRMMSAIARSLPDSGDLIADFDAPIA
jgi:hypothetical protein